MRLLFRSVILALILACLNGCGDAVQVQHETDEPTYRRAKAFLREGRNEEALQAFLSVIAKREDAAESHFEAGWLYLNHIQDPLSAIYHFRQYLAIRPQGELSESVKDLIRSAKRDFASQLPGEPFAEEVDRADLLSKIKQLEQREDTFKQAVVTLEEQLREADSENDRLRRLLAEVGNEQEEPEDRLRPIVIQTNQPAVEQAASTPSEYTVVEGDTLSRISTKVYGTSGRWTEIFEANRDILPSPNALQVGQVLRIPED